MLRDFVFLVKGVSKDVFIYGDNLFFTQFTEGDSQMNFLEFIERRLGMKNWAGSLPVSIFVARNDYPQMEDGFERAFESISGAADVYDTILDDGVGVASIFGVREGDAADAELYGFGKGHGRFRFHSSDGAAEKR